MHNPQSGCLCTGHRREFLWQMGAGFAGLALNNVLLVAFCFTVFIGTIFPLLAEAVTGAKVSVGTPYFNWVSAPILLVTFLLMGAGPLVPWRRGSWTVLGHWKGTITAPAAQTRGLDSKGRD